MINLYDANTGALLGHVSEQQLQFLIDQLEEEYQEDQDYAFTSMTIDYLQGQGAGQELVSLLRRALGDKDEISIRWSRS
jgi:processive 1,2-diacylglycerol beta-glucosyltransferase